MSCSNNTALELINDGRLSVLFIGTGSAFSKRYFQTNVLVVKGEDHLLIDCGTLCPYALEKNYGLELKNIDNLLLTHPHADHIGGVEELALVDRYVKKQKCNLVITDEFKQLLWNESLKGGLKVNEEGSLTLDDYFVQIKPEQILTEPFEMYEANVGSINIKLFRTKHVTCSDPEVFQISYGLMIDDRVLYPCDTQFNPEQIDYLVHNFPVKVIFHDCDISGYSEGVHASYAQLKTLPDEIRAMTYLCHYNGRAEEINPQDDGFKKFARPGVWYRC
ncbi:MAG: MBL fold metallo-hydrolase [Treponema sp.]|nr:MBL fold metallo-hydrolase [Treponema sp.]